MRRVVILSACSLAGLVLCGCAGVDPFPDTRDLCRDSSRCAPQCGSVATGASSECSPAENGGRTRG